MKRHVKPLAGTLLTGAVVLVLGACSSSGSSSGASPASTGTGAGTSGGTITIASGTPPLSADQGLDFTTQGTELYSVVNTPLLTFKRGVQGVAGTQILPALAQSLPTVSNGGKTYTFQLRSGLHYSNGQAIKASDVTYALERDIKIPWQAASFVSAYIQGGTAYASGKAKTISGMVTDDATGKITVNLVAPFAPIVDIFALAGTAPVPQSTPMKNLASTGTIGDGPYKWGAITAGQTYTLVKNTKFDVPGLPRGHADTIVYKVNSNVLANAEQVLNNQADVFDPGDTLPASILQQVKSQASDRYQPIPTNSTYYFWFGVTQKPFNNIYARQAVLAALDDRALSRLASGFLTEDCHLIPPGIDGNSPPVDLPLPQPDRAAEHDEGQAADAAVGHDRPAGDGVRRGPVPAQAVAGLLHGRAELARVQGDREGHQLRRVLHHHRSPDAEAADWLGRLGAGLPPPVGLHAAFRQQCRFIAELRVCKRCSLRFDSQHAVPIRPQDRRQPVVRA